MKCPDCQLDLLLGDRAGVEVNYCPRCRGVWLERGKLDQIIERSSPMAQAQRGPQPPGYQPDPNYAYNQRPYRGHDDDDDDDEHGHRDNRYDPDGRKRRRGGFLGDFLDFG